MRNKPEDIDLCTNLNNAADTIYSIAKNKGFWDGERQKGTLLMLVVSELAEALEADREDKYADLQQFQQIENSEQNEFNSNFETYIKNTFEDELADAMIRILDICGSMGIDLEEHINLKLKYNKQRGYKHEKEY